MQYMFYLLDGMDKRWIVMLGVERNIVWVIVYTVQRTYSR